MKRMEESTIFELLQELLAIESETVKKQRQRRILNEISIRCGQQFTPEEFDEFEV